LCSIWSLRKVWMRSRNIAAVAQVILLRAHRWWGGACRAPPHAHPRSPFLLLHPLPPNLVELLFDFDFCCCYCKRELLACFFVYTPVSRQIGGHDSGQALFRVYCLHLCTLNLVGYSNWCAHNCLVSDQQCMKS
jgi:hypothetical protein